MIRPNYFVDLEQQFSDLIHVTSSFNGKENKLGSPIWNSRFKYERFAIVRLQIAYYLFLFSVCWQSLSQIPLEIEFKNNPPCYIFLRLKIKFNFYLTIKEAGKDPCLTAKGGILKLFETQSSAKYHLRDLLLLPKIYSADVTNASPFMLRK